MRYMHLTLSQYLKFTISVAKGHIISSWGKKQLSQNSCRTIWKAYWVLMFKCLLLPTRSEYSDRRISLDCKLLHNLDFATYFEIPNDAALIIGFKGHYFCHYSKPANKEIKNRSPLIWDNIALKRWGLIKNYKIVHLAKVKGRVCHNKNCDDVHIIFYSI